jgi:hypothetical protein
VGAASNRKKKSRIITMQNRGWKPLPQPKSHKLPLLNLGSNKEFEPAGYCSNPDGSLIKRVKRFNVPG